ncbi:hypothetical protein AIE35_003136 [Salmonella enterica subsp. enterica serovar Oranienburg]|nr:hypothetical protein [Salmonella enterica subsp. enterica serovar Oranienburg]
MTVFTGSTQSNLTVCFERGADICDSLASALTNAVSIISIILPSTQKT